MRLALFTLDSVASNRGIKEFIEKHSQHIVFVGLSRRPGKGLLAEAWTHFRRSGGHFCAYMFVNFVLPRWIGRARPFLRWLGRDKSLTVVELCGAYNIPYAAVANINEAPMQERLKRCSVDVILICYFDQILKAATLEIPKGGAINVHTALLPGHRGPFPVLYGWMDRPPTLGVTLHWVDEGIDTGPIIAQEGRPLQRSETVLSAMVALHACGLQMVGTLIDGLPGSASPARLQGSGTYEPLPTRRTMQRFRRSGGRLVDRRDLVIALRTPIEI